MQSVHASFAKLLVVLAVYRSYSNCNLLLTISVVIVPSSVIVIYLVDGFKLAEWLFKDKSIIHPPDNNLD